MNVWILTIGSSDIQLTTRKNWQPLSREVRSQVDGSGFHPSAGIDGRLQVPARVLGVVYSQSKAEQYFDDLVFPLIDNFIEKIKSESIKIERIILVLSDQPSFSRAERRSQNHPYWQDTCTLKPLIEKHLKQELRESPLEIESLLLRPTSTTEGLDDWNAVLKLVQSEFELLDLSESKTIYVSHQAGTPAISSAIQFTSLSQLGSKVEFLVSSERNAALTKFLESSEYLKSIRKKEAEALLGNHNYLGVEFLLKDYLKCGDEIRALLSAAIQWNVANFNEFLKELDDHPEFLSEVAIRQTEENWWWIAYEEVYLAIVRKNQGNIVESFFHSFRAFEGIFSAWGQVFFGRHIEEVSGVPCLSYSILDDAENYFSKISGKDAKKAIEGIKKSLGNLKIKSESPELEVKESDRVKLNLQTLCNLFKAFRYEEYHQACENLNIFWVNEKSVNVSNKRNFIVHQVQGMSEDELWKFWGVESWPECEARLLKFLNFIVKDDFPEGFESLESASLMAKVHRELEKAIAAL